MTGRACATIPLPVRLGGVPQVPMQTSTLVLILLILAALAMLDVIDQLSETQHEFSNDPEIPAKISQYEMAFRMQTSVPELMDISREPKAVLEAYGAEPGKASFANNCLLARRLADARLAAVTTRIDWLVLALLLLQVATGVYIAFTLRWGGVWYVHTATPWLRSLLTFQPEVQYLAALPAVVKLHAVNAFLLVALLPFSRLVHALSVPLGYLARPYQVVIWYRERSGKSLP